MSGYRGIDPEHLQAYVDDALDADARARVEAAVAANPALASEVAAASRLRARLRAEFDPVLDEPMPERFAALFAAPATPAASVAGNVRALPARRTPPRPAWWMLAAASVAVVAIGLWWQAAHAPVRTADGVAFAGGALAEALDARLAGAPAVDAGVVIGLTFRDRDGRWCRSFEMPEATLSGLACRESGRWHLPLLERGVPAPAGDALRQAASPASPALLGEIDARIAGEPLSADEERAARDAGWR